MLVNMLVRGIILVAGMIVSQAVLEKFERQLLKRNSRNNNVEEKEEV